MAAKTQASPTPVDAYGDHDMVCPLGNPHARHASVQSTYVRVGQDAGLFPRRTTVRELRRPGETGQKQADVAVDNYGPAHDHRAGRLCHGSSDRCHLR